MDQETLGKATRLSEKIDRTKKILQRWETAKRFVNDEINIYYKNDSGGNDNNHTPVSDHCFEIVKAINIQHFTQLLKDLEDEFSKL